MAQEREQVRDDSDELLSELEKLKRLEREKRGESYSSPSFHGLAEQVVDQARSVFHLAAKEDRDGDRTERSDLSIDDVDGAPPPRSSGEDDVTPSSDLRAP